MHQICYPWMSSPTMQLLMYSAFHVYINSFSEDIPQFAPPNHHFIPLYCSLGSRVHLIMVSGDLYKKISFAKSCSSRSISPASLTRKMSVQSFRIRSTLGSSSNMMECEIPLKSSRINFPMTRTTDM